MEAEIITKEEILKGLEACGFLPDQAKAILVVANVVSHSKIANLIGVLVEKDALLRKEVLQQVLVELSRKEEEDKNNPLFGF